MTLDSLNRADPDAFVAVMHPDDRGRVDDLALLNRSLQAWLNDYNHHRPNHGDYMAGRTPVQAKKQLQRRTRHTAA